MGQDLSQEAQRPRVALRRVHEPVLYQPQLGECDADRGEAVASCEAMQQAAGSGGQGYRGVKRTRSSGGDGWARPCW